MAAPRRLVPRVSRRARDGRGAVAVMVAALVVVLFAAAALGVDIASQMTSKQSLHDTMDAAAHAGAYELPANGAGAAAAATTMATAADPRADPVTDLWCVVASTGTPPTVSTSQIPSTCNPGSPPYTPGNYPGLRCNDAICAIPCVPAQGDQCNTVRVADSKTVPYAFAPVIGYDEGSTGEVVSVACKGSCGSEVPNPMDVAVVADRTGSMSSTDINSMINGIKAMLTVMTPSQQYVSLGTIGPARSDTTTTSTTCRSDPYSGSLSSTGTSWKWMSLPFHTDYLTAAATPTVNTSSNLVKAINCLNRSSSTGTHLAAPMKAAARYLLGHDANNLASLPARTGTPRKVLIFETDGQPNESFSGTSTNLTTNSYPGSTSGGTACTNLGNVATNAKAADILVITVAYNLSTDRCSGSSGPTVTGTLAAAASRDSNGNASDADNSCGNATLRATENADGDFFFCAASGDDMANVFRTAIGSAGGGIRLIRLP
ncbi:vWA domain-containing protein [Nocardioides euryhalodurans]|uniref:VWA domain-containing protein n=1 Tax=Nocardioides euryhalodurans TaxID=2518370 RepID=A0A4P7GN43_9ACTN|nr:vWA domain-containing protein [Nocardioides euryhalodurans]QBR93470.1 VWA domain-containing protein [Nocardioides euryhalodurans]